MVMEKQNAVLRTAYYKTQQVAKFEGYWYVQLRGDGSGHVGVTKEGKNWVDKINIVVKRM
jgi:hypothetical protein